MPLRNWEGAKGDDARVGILKFLSMFFPTGDGGILDH